MKQRHHNIQGHYAVNLNPGCSTKYGAYWIWHPIPKPTK